LIKQLDADELNLKIKNLNATNRGFIINQSSLVLFSFLIALNIILVIYTLLLVLIL